MAIVFHCTCGRPLRANLEAAGKRTKCPGCQLVLTIPNPGGKPALTPAGPAPEFDPFAPELDWSTLESRPSPEPDLTRSGVIAIKIDSALAEAPAVDPPRPEDGSRQYRILSQKEQGFSKFNPAKLEELLNDFARRGWSLKAAVAMNLPGHSGNHDELIVILER